MEDKNTQYVGLDQLQKKLGMSDGIRDLASMMESQTKMFESATQQVLDAQPNADVISQTEPVIDTSINTLMGDLSGAVSTIYEAVDRLNAVTNNNVDANKTPEFIEYTPPINEPPEVQEDAAPIKFSEGETTTPTDVNVNVTVDIPQMPELENSVNALNTSITNTYFSETSVTGNESQEYLSTIINPTETIESSAPVAPEVVVPESQVYYEAPISAVPTEPIVISPTENTYNEFTETSNNTTANTDVLSAFSPSYREETSNVSSAETVNTTSAMNNTFMDVLNEYSSPAVTTIGNEYNVINNEGSQVSDVSNSYFDTSKTENNQSVSSLSQNASEVQNNLTELSQGQIQPSPEMPVPQVTVNLDTSNFKNEPVDNSKMFDAISKQLNTIASSLSRIVYHTDPDEIRRRK